jgi:hypothetical protein
MKTSILRTEMYSIKMGDEKMVHERVNSEMCPKAGFGVSDDEIFGLLLRRW